MKRTLSGAAVAVLIAYFFISWQLGFAIEKQINEPLELLKRVFRSQRRLPRRAASP
jgi:hypothetical protein